MIKYAKFGILTAVILGTLAWLAADGIGETKTYYKTVAELKGMGGEAYTKRLRVAGDVAEGSIERSGRQVRFLLTQEKQTLPVLYDGIEPLPDTFRDGAQAVADGKLGQDGTFHAAKIQAKCASKYEAKPGSLPGAPGSKQGSRPGSKNAPGDPVSSLTLPSVKSAN
jgi:cytochrome c-type biogenesis protein CcmE